MALGTERSALNSASLLVHYMIISHLLSHTEPQIFHLQNGAEEYLSHSFVVIVLIKHLA